MQLACGYCEGFGREFHSLGIGDLCVERQTGIPFIYLGRKDDEHWFLRSDDISGNPAKCYGAHIVKKTFSLLSRYIEAVDA